MTGWLRYVVAAGCLLIAAESVALPGICEGIDELEPEDHQDLRRTVRHASVFPEFGLLGAAGLRYEDRLHFSGRYELSAGVTRATIRDLDRFCANGHLPAAIGIHVLVASRGFETFQVGGFVRYYNQLNVAALVPVWELGATVPINDPHVEGRVAAGLGNTTAQLMLLITSDGAEHAGFISIRLDLGLLRWVF